MAAHLEIVWDGTVPGLDDRRLSLEAFGPALRELLAAVRRIASDLELQARGPARERGGIGRLAREAANLDVQIETIRANSPVSLSCVVVPLEQPQRPLIDDLPEQAVDVFLRGVELEARGAPAHYKVRRFLAQLPIGLTHQRYVFRGPDGGVRREVNVADMRIAETRVAPHLIEFIGVIVGFGFEEGKAEIKFRADTGELIPISATREEVEEALPLRLSIVEVLAVAEPSRTRLLRLAPGETVLPTPDQRTTYIFDTWRELLARLAQ